MTPTDLTQPIGVYGTSDQADAIDHQFTQTSALNGAQATLEQAASDAAQRAADDRANFQNATLEDAYRNFQTGVTSNMLVDSTLSDAHQQFVEQALRALSQQNQADQAAQQTAASGASGSASSTPGQPTPPASPQTAAPPPSSAPPPAASPEVVQAIVSRAQRYGIDPTLALATAMHESGLNPQAVGDNGTSFGLYQLHRGGELGNMTPDQAYIPDTNADTALSTMARFAAQNPNLSGGALAAAAQRPANPQAYAAAVDALLPQARALLAKQQGPAGGTGTFASQDVSSLPVVQEHMGEQQTDVPLPPLPGQGAAAISSSPTAMLNESNPLDNAVAAPGELLASSQPSAQPPTTATTAAPQTSPTAPQPGPAPAPTPAAANPQPTPSSSQNNLSDAFRQFADFLDQKATGLREALSAPAPQVQQAVQNAPGAVVSAATNPLSSGVQAVNAVNAVNGTGQPAVPTPEEATTTPGLAGSEVQGIISPSEARAAETMGNVALAGPEAVAAPVASGVDLAKGIAGVARQAVDDAQLAKALGGIDLSIAGGSEDAGPGLQAASQLSQATIAQNPGIVGKVRMAVNDLLAPVKNTSPDVQQAIADFAGKRLEAEVQADTVRLQGKTVLGALDNRDSNIERELTGAVSGATPEQQALIDKWNAFNQETGDIGRELGFIKGDVTQPQMPIAPGMKENPSGTLNAADTPPGYRGRPTGELGPNPEAPAVYVPHIYEDELKKADQAARKAGLSPSGFYSNGRTYATLREAQLYGHTPIDSMSEGQAIYTQRVLDSQAKAELIQQLKASDTVIPLPEKGQLPDGYKALAPDDPVFRGYAAPEPVAKVIKNLVEPSFFRTNPILRGIMETQSGAKMSLFSLSNFHLVTELRQAYRLNGTDGGAAIGKAIWNAVNPKAWQKFRLNNADAFADTARAGVTGLGSRGYGPDLGMTKAGLLARGASGAVTGAQTGLGGYLSAKAQGQSDQDAIKRAVEYGLAGAAGGALIAPAVTKALWERAVPTLKVIGYQSLKQGGMDAGEAAREVNTTFGGQNLEAIARSKSVQDLLRLGVLAPDWWEGWARQFGSALGKGTVKGSLPFMNPTNASDAARAYWIRTAVEGVFLTEGLNLLFNGHFTDQNDPNHKAELELTGLYQKLGAKDSLVHPDRQGPVPDSHRVYADVLGPIRSVVQAAIDKSPGEFAQSHIGMIPSTAMSTKEAADQEFQNTGSRAKSVIAGSEAAAQRLAPIGFQQSAESQQPAAAQALSFLGGTRLSEVSSQQEASQAVQRLIQAVGGEKVWRVLPVSTRARLARAVGLATNPEGEIVGELNNKLATQQQRAQLGVH